MNIETTFMNLYCNSGVQLWYKFAATATRTGTRHWRRAATS